MPTWLDDFFTRHRFALDGEPAADDNTINFVGDVDVTDASGTLDVTVGRAWKKPVRVATTANITLSGHQTIDGVAITNEDVLVQEQSDAEDNGWYTANSGPWTRRTDADASSKIIGGASTLVQEGTVYAGTVRLLTNTGAIVLGTTELTFDALVTSNVGWHMVTAPQTATRNVSAYNDGSGSFSSSSFADTGNFQVSVLTAQVGDRLIIACDISVQVDLVAEEFALRMVVNDGSDRTPDNYYIHFIYVPVGFDLGAIYTVHFSHVFTVINAGTQIVKIQGKHTSLGHLTIIGGGSNRVQHWRNS